MTVLLFTYLLGCAVSFYFGWKVHMRVTGAHWGRLLDELDEATISRLCVANRTVIQKMKAGRK